MVAESKSNKADNLNKGRCKVITACRKERRNIWEKK